MDLSFVLNNIRENSKWSIRGDKIYNNLRWNTENITIKPTLEECQETILPRTMAVHYSVHEWTNGLGSVDMISCFTEEEWIKLNIELGHKMQEKKLNNSQT